MEKYFNVLMILVFVVLVISIFFSLFRTIIGPRRADRIMGINMIGSFSTLALALLAVMYKQSWLLDICLVYCLISFLAVVALTKISIVGVFRFKFVLNRMHCAAIIDSIGFLLIIVGLMFVGGFDYIPKLLLVLCIQWIGSPIASHLVTRLEIEVDVEAKEHMEEKKL